MWQKAASKLFDRAAQPETEHNVGGLPRRCQAGRTLLEMLSVLAIVGILSVTAITGILYAFNKHKANVIIQDVSLTAAVVITNEAFLSVQDEQQIFNPELPKPLSGFPITPFRVNADVFVITVQNVPQSVCKHVMTRPNPSDFLIEVNGAVAKENPKTLCTNNTNTMNFYFDVTQNAERCGGQICANGHVCVDDACVCPDDRIDQNGLCVCKDGSEECNGQCYNLCDFSQPGILGTRDTDTCQCLCDQTAGFISDGDRCVCPPEHLLVQNQCKPFGCRGGTSQSNNWTCYLDGERCGWNCTELGDCMYGYCTNVCAHTEDFKYMPSLRAYGCETEHNTTCTGVSSSFQCEHSDKGEACGNYCPTIEGVNCINGDCQDRCSAYNSEHGTALEWTQATPTFYGCYNPDNGLTCYQSWNVYTCNKGSLTDCAFGCDITGTQCTSNACEGICPNEAVYSVVDNYARCTYADGTWCKAREVCFTPAQVQCATGCTGMDINRCTTGICDTTVCTLRGYTFTTEFGNYGGCTNPDTHVTCFPYNSVYHCYTEQGALCGSNCTGLDGSGCPDCFQSFDCPAGWTSTTAPGISGALENACEKDGITCLEKSQICRNNSGSCADTCSLDGRCERGDCTAEQADCPPYMTFGWVATTASEVRYFGCIDLQIGTKCYRDGSRYTCYTSSNTLCGTGCTINGSDCTNGLCRCDDGYELVDGACQPFSDLIKCTADQCYIGTNPCGTGCREDGTACDAGACVTSDADCPDGTSFGKVTNEFYGCINQETYVSCYAVGSTYTCYYKGTLCGTECKADGTGGSCDTGCI